MKISVVIPAYNEEENIKTCLDAINKQTRKPDEVIVVDNNSTDKTAQIAKSMGAKVVKEKHQGIAWARSKGFNSATGDIFARTDADSIPHKDWIENIERNFKDKNIDALVGDVYYGPSPKLKTALMLRSYLKTIRLLTGEQTLIGPNMSIRKKIWEKVKNNVNHDTNHYHEDLSLSVDIINNGGKIKFDEKVKVDSSGRRMTDIKFYTAYQVRVLRDVIRHRKLSKNSSH